MSLSGAERAKRSRANHALRDELARALVMTDRLAATDIENRDAINAARDDLCMEWARAVTSDATDLLRRGCGGKADE